MDYDIKYIEIQLSNPKTNHIVTFHIPALAFWALYQTIKNVGAEQAITLMGYGVELVNDCITDDEGHKLAGVIRAVDQFLRHAPDPERIALQFSYQLLSTVKISRAEAAEFAAEIIGKPVPIDSWRKRVDAYARDHHLSPVGLTRGKRPKGKTER